MTEKGILVFALLLTFQLSIGNYCADVEPAGPSGSKDSIYCLVARQAPDDDGPTRNPYSPTFSLDYYTASGVTGPAGDTGVSPSAPPEA